MDSEGLLKQIEVERRRNLEDIIRHARWQAEMVKKLGSKWFEQRDRWLHDMRKAASEMWRIPEVRHALLEAIRAKDRIARARKAML